MAGRRCSSCGLLCSVEVEILSTDLNVDSDGCVNGTVEMVMDSSCCGDEVAQADVELNPPEAGPYVPEECKCKADERNLEIEEKGDNEVTDEYVGKGKRPKHFYIAQIPVEVACTTCGKVREFTMTGKAQASEFENMN